MDVAEAPYRLAADVVIVSCVAYALCFVAYAYVWKTRFFPPLRVKVSTSSHKQLPSTVPAY